MSAAFFSPAIPTTLPTLSTNTHFCPRPQLFSLLPKQNLSLSPARSAGNGAGAVVGSAAVEEKAEAKETKPAPDFVEEVKKEEALDANGAVVEDQAPPKFMDKRWVAGTWDLTEFGKDGKTDWDAVIDAEARRRKWLEDNPEASSNDEPVVFDTAIIPWWAWIKRYHLPEAELLNGRAAMIGFFMAYFVDSLTGIGLVGQTGNFFCKTLLFVAVAGVLLIRKNEDIETLKKLIDESTFYDKQWQATWQDDTPSDSKE